MILIQVVCKNLERWLTDLLCHDKYYSTDPYRNCIERLWMNRFELTVIVPFTAENTLQTAVFNLLNENFASEILLIDDGSSDLSNEIARELQKI